ncbi:hypothetical protein [Cylindrospermum sp. FACHB-282]|uniref:hypothetical protein n=1 Tax=Cylindrospermum sp. FACHB-282 TaxID=2692794 RepID=UPI0016822230|nr:hypothetical protein [Cylindrospermum sp. FACHB-282]MBD2384156.1 hypothetical protein [Cylindrospermum sp. FACHB-282]
MKEARHIKTGKIVRASEADYENFYGIYQCPYCKSVLRLTKPHTRDGKTINAAFVHLEFETEEQRNCPERISIDFGDQKSVKNSPESKGQFHRKLKKNFLKCLKRKSKDGLIEYYKYHKISSEETLKYIDLLINLSSKIVGVPQNGRYILDLEYSGRIQKIFTDKAHNKYSNKINLSPSDSIYRSLFIICTNLDIKSAPEKSNSLIWGIEFLINEADDDFRKKALNYIFGKYVFNGEIEKTIKIDVAGQVLGIQHSLLLQVEKVLSDKKLTNSFFSYMYSKEDLNSNTVLFEEVKLFHKEIFNFIENYLVDFDWNCLLN